MLLKCASCREITIEKSLLLTLISNIRLIRHNFQSSVRSRTYGLLHGGSHKIKFTVPLICFSIFRKEMSV